MRQIIIPSSVTHIGDSAFQLIIKLTHVTIPNSVVSIGKYAFADLKLLTEIEIPSSVKSIGNYGFAYCDKLARVTIPSSVDSIGKNAFNYCTSLTQVTVLSRCARIGECAFEKCTSLTQVTIHSPVERIEKGAFAECTSLTEITVPSSETKSEESSSSSSSLLMVSIPIPPLLKCGYQSLPDAISSDDDDEYAISLIPKELNDDDDEGITNQEELKFHELTNIEKGDESSQFGLNENNSNSMHHNGFSHENEFSLKSTQLHKNETENNGVYKQSQKDKEDSIKYGITSQVSPIKLLNETGSDSSLAMCKKEAEQGNIEAQEALAMKFSKENDTENFVKYCIMFIKSGNTKIPLEFAVNLYRLKKFSQAFNYFSLLKEINHPIARFYLGVMKFYGHK